MVVDLGVCKVCIDGYLFDLGGVDLILGIEWLHSLGDAKVNWDEMQINFVQKSKEVLLQGDPAFSRTVVSLKSLIKTSHVEFWGAIWAIGVSKGEADSKREREHHDAKKIAG